MIVVFLDFKNLISRPGFDSFNNFEIFFHDSLDQLIINLNRYHDYKLPHQLKFQSLYLYLIKCCSCHRNF
jgi:hypothetical protein